jgi:thiamine monophosphate synthase
LWLVLDRQAAAPRSLPEVTDLAIRGGVDVVLCRIKDAPAELVLRQSRPVRDICSKRGTPFVMSHFPELALELAADGVQLGVADAPLAA